MKDNNYIFVIDFKDFINNYVSLFGSIGFIMCICGREVPNDKPLPSVEVAKPPTQNWSKEKTLIV